MNENSTHSFIHYGNDNQSQSLSFEVEKLKLMLAHKDEVIALKDNEIKTLHALVASLKDKH